MDRLNHVHHIIKAWSIYTLAHMKSLRVIYLMNKEITQTRL